MTYLHFHSNVSCWYPIYICTTSNYLIKLTFTFVNFNVLFNSAMKPTYFKHLSVNAAF